MYTLSFGHALSSLILEEQVVKFMKAMKRTYPNLMLFEKGKCLTFVFKAQANKLNIEIFCWNSCVEYTIFIFGLLNMCY